MPYLQRHLTQTILRAAATFPAVLITGARQTGKTTLLRREFGASHRYLSLERPDIRARAQADPIAFLAEAAPPAILDEIQYAPDLLHFWCSIRPGSKASRLRRGQDALDPWKAGVGVV